MIKIKRINKIINNNKDNKIKYIGYVIYTYIDLNSINNNKINYSICCYS